MKFLTNDFEIIDGVLNIAPGTAYIRSQAFCGHDDIVKVVIPDGVGFMEDECFTECPELKEVCLPEGLINIGPAAFAECPQLCRINLPKSIKSIDCGAFFYCESLREITLPDGLESIGEYAFQNTGLESVSVPESVKSLDECAFFSCENLRKICVAGADTKLGTDCFGSNYKLIEGYVAGGYPENADFAAELLYTLLWCSCPQRHTEATSRRAISYIKSHEGLIMERILKADNTPAMTGLAQLGLLSSGTVNEALRQTLAAGQTELSALLLKAKNAVSNSEEEFEL